MANATTAGTATKLSYISMHLNSAGKKSLFSTAGKSTATTVLVLTAL